jgi:uncharacterized membrane protein
MADVPMQLIIAAFHDENGADAALKEIKAAKRDGWIKIDNAAVIRRDANDKLHINDTRDMGGGKGAVVGGVIGAVVGVIFPPALLASAGIGAVAGGLIAKFSDGGLPDSRLREIGEALKPGTSAIVAVIEHVWVAEVEAQMAAQGAQVFVDTVKADIAEQLAAGHDLTYTALATSDAVGVARISDAEAAPEAPAAEAAALEAPAAEAAAPEAPAAEAAAPVAEETKPEEPKA